MECKIFRDQMMDVLYGEADAPTAERLSQHQAVCSICRDEMTELRALRRDLGVWELPSPLRTRSFLRRQSPQRVLAAAAVLLMAIGSGFGLSGSELRYERGQLAFRLGRASEPTAALLSQQEARHRQEMEALRASFASVKPHDDAALLLKVEEMIKRSEERQAGTLTASLADINQKTDAQRRYDLARVSAGLSYLDGKTGEQVARATELMGYVLQASQKR